MKKNLITNFKYIAFGAILAAALSVVHAGTFTAPSASAPSSNVDVPLHTGPDQVKDGGLSVNTFTAWQNAQFKQQLFLNGIVFGGTPTNSGTTSTVVMGDTTTPANLSVNGGVSASAFITSASVANSSSLNVCANSTGTLVTCTGQSANTTPPSLTQVVYTSSSTTSQTFEIGTSIQAGDIFTLEVYSHPVSVTAASGDVPEMIVQRLMSAINFTTPTQWNDHNSAPAPGTAGFPPTAQSSSHNPQWIILTVDSVHRFGGSATRP
ncbi:MAG: hypothetical protein JWM92_379 [Candidatus Nomurabacteria bacterium]|nr:hypothetical protein [Candidatus Nomurabacteria bacterium]